MSVLPLGSWVNRPNPSTCYQAGICNLSRNSSGRSPDRSSRGGRYTWLCGNWNDNSRFSIRQLDRASWNCRCRNWKHWV